MFAGVCKLELAHTPLPPVPDRVKSKVGLGGEDEPSDPGWEATKAARGNLHCRQLIRTLNHGTLKNKTFSEPVAGCLGSPWQRKAGEVLVQCWV